MLFHDYTANYATYTSISKTRHKNDISIKLCNLMMLNKFDSDDLHVNHKVVSGEAFHNTFIEKKT